MGNYCCGFQHEPPPHPPPPTIYNNPPPTTTITTNPPGNDGGSTSAPRRSDDGGSSGGGGGSVAGMGRTVNPDLKVYTYQELMIATGDFKRDSMLGEGGFGKVYKGWIDASTLGPSSTPGSGRPVAVKRCNPDSAQGVKEWETEIEFLGKFSHPNLVKLIGYCREVKELLLVYEYIQNGSLDQHLFTKDREPPSWSERIKIATDAARGLEFLHTTENIVIYRDFKSANILLDEHYNAKLSDFGLVRQGPPGDVSHVTTQIVGTYGYVSPEYINTGRLYVKSDVYGFGVVLLELISGLRAYDMHRASGKTRLVVWCEPMLKDKPKLKNIVDERMREYSSEGVFKLAQLITRCLEPDPKPRPDMSEVLTILETISTLRVDRAKASKASSSQSKAKIA